MLQIRYLGGEPFSCGIESSTSSPKYEDELEKAANLCSLDVGKKERHGDRLT